MLIKMLLEQAYERLKASSSSARLDVEILLMQVLNKSRAYLYAYGDEIVSATDQEIFRNLVEERFYGKPIAYLTGQKEFWSLNLKVDEHTLIPRPETELVVEQALSYFPITGSIDVLDLGTGSGAIALALAFERPQWHVMACDISASTLVKAQENATALKINNIYFFQSDWFDKIPHPASKFDLITANPPYIAMDDPHLLQGDLRYEPSTALISGKDGLTALKHIIKHSFQKLKLGGLLLLEHGYDQKTAVKSMLIKYGYQQITCIKDYQGQDRVSSGKRII